MKYAAGRFVLQVGTLIAQHFAVKVLERAVSPFFSFILGTPTDCHVAVRIVLLVDVNAYNA